MKKDNKVSKFFRRYGYYCLAGILTVAIAATIAFAVQDSGELPIDDTIPTQTETLTFGLPLNEFTILKGYFSDSLQYNVTLNQWEAHKAVDLYSANSSVFAVLDGTVTSLETTYEHGTKIILSHAEGFTSVYSSLAENAKVSVGDKVFKGQEIGNISNTASQESKDGVHLHFEMFKDGAKVDPSNYIALENK